jgi:hypothetical protein
VDQLCAGLEAGIEGGIHAVELLWESMKDKDKWGFLLIDAKNAFNKGNQMGMLWTIRHKWPSGARFTFNCYKHWGTLVLRGKHNWENDAFLFSKEGVTQGGPLSMFA